MQGHLAVVEYLCQASADVNKADNDGYTPLYVAAQNVSIQSKDCMHVATVMPWVMTAQRLYTSMNTWCYVLLYYTVWYDIIINMVCNIIWVQVHVSDFYYVMLYNIMYYCT